MPKTGPARPKLVREPAQVYLAPDDNELLTRLAAEASLSKAEVLRRGIRSFARELRGVTSPMLAFFSESTAEGWEAGVAADHDAVLAAAYKPPVKKRR